MSIWEVLLALGLGLLGAAIAAAILLFLLAQ